MIGPRCLGRAAGVIRPARGVNLQLIPAILQGRMSMIPVKHGVAGMFTRRVIIREVHFTANSII